jgi:Leucine-rich repeat (LRR) protein
MLPVVSLGGERHVEKWKGIECFVTHDTMRFGHPVVELDFIGCNLRDRDLKKLASVKSTLKSLNLRYNSKVTDAGLHALACLKNLETLYLPCTNIGDAGLKELTPLKQLRQLSLADTRVTDAGLKKVAALKNLRYLDLSGTPVTNAAVQELQKALPRCEINRVK